MLNANCFRTLNDVRKTLTSGGRRTTAYIRTVRPWMHLPSSDTRCAMEMRNASCAFRVSTARLRGRRDILAPNLSRETAVMAG